MAAAVQPWCGPGDGDAWEEVGRREVEGSAVRRRRVGMPCGFASEGRVSDVRKARKPVETAIHVIKLAIHTVAGS